MLEVNLGLCHAAEMVLFGIYSLQFLVGIYSRRKLYLALLTIYIIPPLTLGLIGRDGGLSTLYHGCGFACQQRVVKTFPGPGHLRSKGRLVWL